MNNFLTQIQTLKRKKKETNKKIKFNYINSILKKKLVPPK